MAAVSHPALWLAGLVLVLAFSAWQCLVATATVASQIQHPAGEPCKDNAGNAHAVGATWRTQGGCDKNVCYKDPKNNYTVTYSCRRLGPNENPDPVNCQYVSLDATLPFPSCCPTLTCAPRVYGSTTTAASCRDIQSNSTCYIWKTYMDGCSQALATPKDIYNFTSVYCRRTCQFC